jgi:hypothetical protein
LERAVTEPLERAVTEPESPLERAVAKVGGVEGGQDIPVQILVVE